VAKHQAKFFLGGTAMGMQVQDVTENYVALANAIILQAVKDYRAALKTLKKNPKNTSALKDKADVERFFCSAWYGELTTVDGKFLLRKLQQEVE